ncbi:MAG: hypothetical protein ACRDRX_24475 [Pseudonocardiaceae bacterium]
MANPGPRKSDVRIHCGGRLRHRSYERCDCHRTADREYTREERLAPWLFSRLHDDD